MSAFDPKRTWPSANLTNDEVPRAGERLMADLQERLRNVWAGILAVEAPGNDPNKWTLLSCSKVYLINEGEYDLTAEWGPFDREEANSNPDPRQGLIKRGEAFLIDEITAEVLPLLRYQIDLVLMTAFG